MRKSDFVLAALILLGCSHVMAQSATGGRFDGKWLTNLSCPAKGNTEGYTWQFAGVVQNGGFRADRGTPGEPGYLLIEGKIEEDGDAKLSASGIVASRQYARGVLAHKGEEYSYEIKAHFTEATGTGKRNTGLGIVGRPCTFDFTKQTAPSTGGQGESH
jgi:hypothetical protein